MDSSYDNAIGRVMPGTFVPDIVPGAPKTQPLPDEETGAAAGASFRDTVKQLLSDVNDKMAASDEQMQQLATGETHDVTKVVTSVEEANLAFQFTLAVRNKLLDAYREINQMQL